MQFGDTIPVRCDSIGSCPRVPLDLEQRYCAVCGADETLLLVAGDTPNNYEGCSCVEDGGVSILYAIWSTEASVVKAKETEVTNNPPSGVAAAALSMLNKLLGFSQAWVYHEEGGPLTRGCPNHH